MENGRCAVYGNAISTHFNWADTKALADQIRTQPVHGLHVFLYDNTFHGVYTGQLSGAGVKRCPAGWCASPAEPL
jgi:hypothetical protein